MLHLFNVPFRKWNPCNPTDMVTSWCITPLWNLIRAKTVYQYLEPDIYWKWPLVKVIAGPWRGFQMSLWSFCFVWVSKMYQSHQARHRQPLRTQPPNACVNIYKEMQISKNAANIVLTVNVVQCIKKINTNFLFYKSEKLSKIYW